MMTDKYDLIFDAYKEYIESNSKYSARVVKYNNNTSTYFPLITFVLSDNRDNDSNTMYDIDKFEKFYFTINIYTKNKIVDGETIAAQVIDKELETLTTIFFKNLQKTQNRPIPNLDTSVFRRTMQYSCSIGNRGNIIRR
jgi:hypothetical protein